MPGCWSACHWQRCHLHVDRGLLLLLLLDVVAVVVLTGAQQQLQELPGCPLAAR